MPLFSKHGKSDAWHKNIAATASSKYGATTESLLLEQNFPSSWPELRQHTDTYLAKKGNLTQQDKDERLVALVRKYPDKELLLAAVIHALTAEATRNLLLSDFKAEPGTPGYLIYLQAIQAVRTIKPEAVTDVEAQVAQSLLSLSRPSSSIFNQNPEVLLPILQMRGISHSSLLASHIKLIAQTTCTNFAAQVEKLKRDGHWLRAFNATRWLVSLPQTFQQLDPLDLGAEQLIDQAFASWRSWAAWQPNTARLQKWEAFSKDEFSRLQKLLSLEGPDFETSRRATLLEGTIWLGSRSSFSHVLRTESGSSNPGELQDMLKRLLSIIDKASLASPGRKALLMHLCVNKPIDHEALRILETVGSGQDSAIDHGILQLLTYGESEARQRDSLLQLLPELGRQANQELCCILAPRLTDRISTLMERMQSKLRGKLSAGAQWDGFELNLLDYGNMLRGCNWIRDLIDPQLRILLDNWPASQQLRCLADVRSSAVAMNLVTLTSDIDSFCWDCLIQRGHIDVTSRWLIETLLAFWQVTTDKHRRELAMLVLKGSTATESASYCACLTQVPTLGDDTVRNLARALRSFHLRIDRADAAVAIGVLTGVLAQTPSADVRNKWRPILRHMIEQEKSTLVGQLASSQTAVEWINWMNALVTIFRDVFENPFLAPAVPQPWLRNWVRELSGYVSTFDSLDKHSELRPAILCILGGAGGDGAVADLLMQILACVRKVDSFEPYRAAQFQRVMLPILAQLSISKRNSREVREALTKLSRATTSGAAACAQIIDLRQTSAAVAEVMLASIFQNQRGKDVDRQALKAVAVVFGIVIYSRKIKSESMKATADFFSKQVAELVAEARRLDGLQIALKRVDPAGTTTLLASLGIEDSSPADDALANLPATLVNVIDRIDDQEVEMQFPINQLTPLQRVAMGVGDAQNLVVRVLVGDSAIKPGFCIHLDSDLKSLANSSQDTSHHHWDLMRPQSHAPVAHYCCGKPSRATYQLARLLYCYLQKNNNNNCSLEAIHTFVSKSIKELGHYCVVCGKRHGRALRRPTTCNPECTRNFRQVDLEIRLADIWNDQLAAELLLTTTYAAALSGKPDLLPFCPVTDITHIQGILHKLPRRDTIQQRNLKQYLATFGPLTEALLSWVFCEYRGFLTSATGQLKIPNMAGAYQFVLAGAAAERETAFAAHMLGQHQPSRILFHGTGWDRLYAILCQGLRVCSGTALQTHGAVHGNGIYMAEEPNLAWGYARATPATGCYYDKFSNMQLLLGCEYIGDSQAVTTHKIHVIADPSRLMLRYIFVMPANTQVPAARNITPAMMSGIAMLK